MTVGDNYVLAIAGLDQTIRLWNVGEDQNAVYSRTRMHTDGVIRALAWRPHTRLLASASDDHRITLWDVDGQTPVRTLSGHTDRVESLAWSPDGRTLAIANDSTVVLWDVTP